MNKILPYVYISREKNSPYFYIGYRHANYLPSSEDFGHFYFTSSEYVSKNFNNFEHTILAEFYTKEDAYEYESKLISEMNNEYLLNCQSKPKKKYQKQVIDNSPKVCALDGCNKVFTNWRRRCCCSSHQRQYAGTKGGFKSNPIKSPYRKLVKI